MGEDTEMPPPHETNTNKQRGRAWVEVVVGFENKRAVDTDGRKTKHWQ